MVYRLLLLVKVQWMREGQKENFSEFWLNKLLKHTSGDQEKVADFFITMSLLSRYICYLLCCTVWMLYMQLQNDEYYFLGVYFVMSVLQGGCGFPFLAEPLYNYLVHGLIKVAIIAGIIILIV